MDLNIFQKRIKKLTPSLEFLLIWRKLTNKIWLSKHTPFLVVIFLVFGLIAATNFPFNSWLTGWDNLHPEFNLGLNIRRAFLVWYNEGLGIMGGHGYAATLLHSLFIGLLSVVFPDFMLRSIFTFLMLIVGGLGCYFLVNRIGDKKVWESRIAATLAAIFYMVNIGTVQNFYIQLEAFIIHFAFLPWFILTLYNYYSYNTRRYLIWFALICLLSSPQGFIPPLFIVVVIYFLVISIAYFINSKKFKYILIAGLVFIMTNAYWLMSVGYYTLTSSGTYLEAFNNQTSTSDFIEKNRKFGTIKDVALLRGFLFEAKDTDSDGSFFYFLYPWKIHFENPLVAIVGYLFFALLSISWSITLIKRRSYIEIALAIVLLLSFTALATNTQPFALLSYVLQTYIPIFKQAFRVAFTKFSISTALLYSLFIGLGIRYFLEKFGRKKYKILFTFVTGLFLLIIALPIFSGNFIYNRTRINIPNQYFELFSFFKNQNKNERILNLPQGWNWGWSVYDWQYSGSGFLWYGIEQPIMDRAFDVWSNYLENYYWEISRALYAEDYVYFDKLLTKYDISWVLYDPNILAYPSAKADIFTDRIGKYLETDSQLTLYREFNSDKEGVKPTQIYKVIKSANVSPVSIISNIPNIKKNSFWENIDKPYVITGAYFQEDKVQFNQYYPFSSFFSTRAEDKFNTVGISSNDKKNSFYNINLKTSLPNLSLSKYSDSEEIIPVDINISINETNQLEIKLKALIPELMIGSSLVQSNEQNIDTLLIPLDSNQNVGKVIINGLEINDFDNSENTSFLNLKNNNLIIVLDEEGNLIFSDINYYWPYIFNENKTLNLSDKLSNTDNITVNISKVKNFNYYSSNEDINFYNHQANNCSSDLVGGGRFEQTVVNENGAEYVKFSSKNSHNCYSIDIPNLSQKFGYLVKVVTRTYGENGLRFSVENKETGRLEFETTLSDTRGEWKDLYYFIPKMKKDGMGYILSFDNISSDTKKVVNDLSLVEISWFPIDYITSIHFSDNNIQWSNVEENLIVNNLGNWLYYANLSEENTVSSENTIIKLSQAYHDGWVAIKTQNSKIKNQNEENKKYFLGMEILPHVKVNNWANGWEIKKNQESRIMNQGQEEQIIYIFFWPQVLEFVGFGMLVGLIGWIVFKRKKLARLIFKTFIIIKYVF